MTDARQGRGSALRIWHQSVNELDHLEVYKRALEAHAAEVTGLSDGYVDMWPRR
jgi:allantoin racemase